MFHSPPFPLLYSLRLVIDERFSSLFVSHQQTTGDDDAIPIRWQCPEAVLGRVYTAKSDVYSYGVLLFEIYSGGATPFSNLAASEVLRVVKAGHRLARPRTDRAEEMFVLMRALE
jgi:serine/threonine protein kinase